MQESFLQVVNHRTKARLFLLRKLPAAFFSGVRIQTASAEQCTVSVPYNWFTQNPFRSTYFACLGMAAELSTGVLAMNATYGRKPAVSMLVVQLKGQFLRKATHKTIFTCSDGLLLQQGVKNAIETAMSQEVTAYSKGVDADGNNIADFWLTWSFKVRK